MSLAAGDASGDGDQLHSLLGSYLAANFAKNENDPDQRRRLLPQRSALDPGNEVLLEQAFQTEASEAQLGSRRSAWPTSSSPRMPSNRMAHLVLGLNRFKSGDYAKADKEFEAASDGPIGELTSALARAWTALAAGDAAAAP